MKVAQILYSGLGGHGDVAFGILEGGGASAFTNALAFVGIEPLLPAYATRAQACGASHFAIRSVQGEPWRTWPRLFGWLQRERPDAVILHSPPSLLPCLSYARLHRKPLVVVEHQTNGLKTRAEKVFSRLAQQAADRVVVLTEDYARDLEGVTGAWYRRGKVRVIANGVSTERPLSAGHGLVERRVRLGMAARFSTTKRFDVLIDMMEQLAPHLDARLTLAGAGTELAPTQERAARSTEADRIEFPGVVVGEALGKWYRDLDIYVHASEGESLSISLLQAMAASLPVVASDRPGIGSLLDQDGLLVEQSAAAFATAVRTLVDAPDHALALGRRARERVVARYGHAAMFERYRSLLAELGVP